MPSHLPPGKQDQSRAPFLQRVVLHAFAGTTDPSDSLLAPRTFGLRPYMLGLCPTRPPGRVSPVPPCSFPACRRLGPRENPAFVPVKNAVYCLRRDMKSSALPNTFRLIICRGYCVHSLLQPAGLLPSFTRAFDTPPSRSDLSLRPESATGRSGAYPDRTLTC